MNTCTPVLWPPPATHHWTDSITVESPPPITDSEYANAEGLRVYMQKYRESVEREIAAGKKVPE